MSTVKAASVYGVSVRFQQLTQDHQTVDLAFTDNLGRWSLPELTIVGLDRELAALVLTEVAEYCIVNKVLLQRGDHIYDVLDAGPLRVCELRNVNRISSLEERLRSCEFRQLLYPVNGHFLSLTDPGQPLLQNELTPHEK